MSFRGRTVSWAITVAVLGFGMARAEDAPRAAAGDPQLSALIDEALDRNPAIQAASASADAARSRPDQAAALPDPTLSIAYTNDGWSPSLGAQEMTTLAFMWSQAIPGPGRRHLRGEVRRAEARSAAQEIERAKLGTIAAVRRAYYGLMLARELLALGREQQTLWTEVEQSARSRYGVGLGTQYDVLRAQVEATRMRESLIDQEAEIAVRTAELNRLVGRPLDAEVQTAAHLELRPLDRALSALVAEGERVSPELNAAASGIERAQVAVRLAQRERRPELSVQAGYMNRGGLDPMWQAGASFSLPRGKKGAAALAEATAETRAADARRASLGLDLRLRTEERVARARAVEQIAGLYAEGVVPQGQAALEAALASYETGKLPFLTVLDALNQLYADRAAYLRQVARHESLKAALDEWSLDPTPEMASAPMSAASRLGGVAAAAATSASAGADSAGGPGKNGGGSMSMSR
jgi:cobalt-zinc-cadmium efflux system outer membrane protein